jgi:acetyl esterase
MRSSKLDPAARAILEAMDAQPPLHTVPIEQARANREGMRMLGGEPEPVAKVEDIEIAGKGGPFKVRVYTPEASGGPHAGLVYYHGGGFVLGDLESHDAVCRAIARRSGVVVIAVDYRLAPENKFPAAVEDCHTALLWVAQNAASLNIDARRIAVGGDSAGGNLATVIARRIRDERGPSIAFQVLIYPVADMRNSETSSMREFGADHFLSREAMQYFTAQYAAKPEDTLHPDMSPLLAEDLRGLPPALVITAECDPLCSEGEAYAQRLKEAGVPVTYSCYPGMIHGFVSMLGVLAGGLKAVDEVAAALRAMQPAAAASHA